MCGKRWLAIRRLSNFEDTSHQRPISAAARRNDLEMVELLLEHGADPSLPEEGAPRRTGALDRGLSEAAGDGEAVARARREPEHRAGIERPRLAAREKRSGAAEPCCCEYGAREDTSDRKELETLIGDNALEEVEKLLQKRAELGQELLAFWGEGILAGPANSGHREMIELLMRYGARVPDVSKWAPYYYFKHTEIAALLLESGMNPNHMNWHHFTLAASHGGGRGYAKGPPAARSWRRYQYN